MAGLSEVGIQSIAISQASSAMELGLYLRDIRNDNKTQSEPLMSSPGRKQSSGTKRKSFINVFLWVHIAIFFSIPCVFWIMSSYLINRQGIESVDQIRKDKVYMHYLLISLIIQATSNLYIAILLSIIQGRTIHFLKKQFGTAFQKETNQISRVLVTFTVTFFIRAILEFSLGYYNTFSTDKFPSQFLFSLELMLNGLVSYMVPIGLIFFLHHRNSRTNR